MAPGVYEAIHDYLKQMHKELIWPSVGETPPRAKKNGSKKAEEPQLPIPNLRPDKLVRFRYALMKLHSNAYTLFDPPRPCEDTERDCKQGEECIDGFCTPVGGIRTLSEGQRCTSTEQCQQGEECIEGICTPVPHDLIFAPASSVPDYAKTSELLTALAKYYEKIARLLIAALAKHPGRIATVRKILIRGYADCCKIAAVQWGQCSTNGDCWEGFECIDGICVPVPFKLKFPQSIDPIM